MPPSSYSLRSLHSSPPLVPLRSTPTTTPRSPHQLPPRPHHREAKVPAITAGRHQRPNSRAGHSFERGGQQRSRRLAPLRGRERAPLVGGRGVVTSPLAVPPPRFPSSLIAPPPPPPAAHVLRYTRPRAYADRRVLVAAVRVPEFLVGVVKYRRWRGKLREKYRAVVGGRRTWRCSQHASRALHAAIILCW